MVRSWLLGSRIPGCSRDSRGTYTCTLNYSGGVKRIYWNPSRSVTVHTVKSARAWVGILGAEHVTSGGKALGVGKSPIMVRSAK